jgi:hypothetical protein
MSSFNSKKSVSVNNTKQILSVKPILKTYLQIPLNVLLRAIRVQKHPFHLVKPSPYPVVSAIGAFGLVRFIAHKFHDMTHIKSLNFTNETHFN